MDCVPHFLQCSNTRRESLQGQYGREELLQQPVTFSIWECVCCVKTNLRSPKILLKVSHYNEIWNKYIQKGKCLQSSEWLKTIDLVKLATEQQHLAQGHCSRVGACCWTFQWKDSSSLHQYNNTFSLLDVFPYLSQTMTNEATSMTNGKKVEKAPGKGTKVDLSQHNSVFSSVLQGEPYKRTCVG